MEIRDLLPKNVKIFSNLDFKISSPKETGKTFKQNSLIKAKYFSKKTKKYVSQMILELRWIY